MACSLNNRRSSKIVRSVEAPNLLTIGLVICRATLPTITNNDSSVKTLCHLQHIPDSTFRINKNYSFPSLFNAARYSSNSTMLRTQPFVKGSLRFYGDLNALFFSPFHKINHKPKAYTQIRY